VSITLESIVVRSPEVLFQNLDGEAVLLDLASESYFGLNPVGTRIWELLDGDRRLRDALEVLSAEYEVERTRLEGDLLALIDQLAGAGLVTLRP
jgi:hypothetical protein